jgi:hypothetical protein
MFTRILLVACILGSTMFAADPVSNDSKHSAQDAISAVLDRKGHSCANTPNEQNTTADRQISDKGEDLFAQVVWASACVTPVGYCPLAVALPVGAPCTCYGPYGAASGIAR